MSNSPKHELLATKQNEKSPLHLFESSSHALTQSGNHVNGLLRERNTTSCNFHNLQSTTYKYTTCYNQLNHLEIRSKNPRSEQCRALWSWSHEVVLEKPLTLPPFYFPLPVLHIQLLLPLIVVVPTLHCAQSEQRICRIVVLAL